ncbi:Protocadherin-1 [Paragonimus heterotremus]|uniref:Protocadherin-1 n=1 Tax=Paragonimus heterotremus TaxID=100268 RepID=A0A8J4TF55_9TREM|nr:Protocadherin-1 [Paragonimus heterotremus]
MHSPGFRLLLGFTVLLDTYVPSRADTPPVVRFVAKEESPLRTTIGNVSNFLLPQPNIITDSVFFNITPAGLIQLAQRLDLEALCTEKSLCCEQEKPCELTFSAVIESRMSRDMQTLEIRVQVLDINDNAPMFASSSSTGQILEVSESAPVGSMFDLAAAFDRDVSKENQIQRYNLHGTELRRMFELDNSEPPVVRLRLLNSLDYEKVTRYAGSLEACDPRSCVRQNLSVFVTDTNDNRPAFLKTSYAVSIPENFTVGQPVLQLEAEDQDSPPNARMDFRFHGEVDQGILNTFRLDRESGKIVLRTHLAAHRRSEYRFEVSVLEASSDTGQLIVDSSGGSGSSSSSTVSVASNNLASVIILVEDLNDFSPVIKMFSPTEGQSLSVKENVPPTRVCVVQVTDNDSGENGRVTCQLIPNPSSQADALDAFNLTASGKWHTLSTTRPFDAELEPQLTVTIACTDFGEPRRSSSRELIVKVEDTNEFPPVLEKTSYHTSVYENAEAGLEIVRVVARDQDYSAHLHYELSAQGRQYFKVDSNTGSITTLGETVWETLSTARLSSVLDREKTERITFTVCISDGGPNSSSVVCDESDETGKLGQVDKLQQQLNTHSADSLVYTVSATVHVTVLDRNDNQPEFVEKGPFTVSENQPRFTQVNGRLAAIDHDEGENGHVRFNLRQVWKISSGMPAPDLFQVDADGRIQTMEILDRETTNAYTLELVACDSAPQTPLCASLNVTVAVLDENDNKPSWRYPHDQDKEVNITADLPPGHVIARVHATDPDAGENGRVTYTLIDPLRRTVFQVDNLTGDVAIAQGYPISGTDEGGNKQTDSRQPSPLLPGIYRLRLRASDQGHPQQTTETWLQVNVFTSDTAINPGLNFMIIVVMVAVTGLISICLVIAIICVRRRSTSLRPGQVSGPDHVRANGSRRSRDAGDGAEGVHFPLKHEYGYPIDGTGYMMGISPTPSDLDILKLGYPHLHPSTATLTYMGAANGSLDSAAHVLGWAGLNSQGTAVCYPVGEPLGYFTEQTVDTSPVDSNHSVTLRMPMYAPLSRIASTAGSDTATLRLVQRQQLAHSSGSQHGETPSSACLSFTSTSPIPSDSQVVNSMGMQSFNDLHADRHQHRTNTMGLVLVDDAALAQGFDSRNSGTSYSHPHHYHPSVQPLRGSCGVHDGQYTASRQNCTPLSSGANSNFVGYCPTVASRRICSLPHCELDVESADSGRGPSEDDPGQLMLGTSTVGHSGLHHFYPTFHLASSAHQIHVNGFGNEVGNISMNSGTVEVSPLSGCNGVGPLQLDLKDNTDTSTAVGVGQTTDGWSSSERRRLKC